MSDGGRSLLSCVVTVAAKAKRKGAEPRRLATRASGLPVSRLLNGGRQGTRLFSSNA